MNAPQDASRLLHSRTIVDEFQQRHERTRERIRQTFEAFSRADAALMASLERARQAEQTLRAWQFRGQGDCIDQ